MKIGYPERGPGSNSLKDTIIMPKPMKRQECSGIERRQPHKHERTTIPTCEEEAEILLSFQLLLLLFIFSILVLSIRICTRFPRLMTEHQSNNKYNVILCTLSLLLDQFEKEDQLFAAQCI